MLLDMKATAAEWAERVRAWRESGLSAEDFARDKGFKAKLLHITLLRCNRTAVF